MLCASALAALGAGAPPARIPSDDAPTECSEGTPSTLSDHTVGAVRSERALGTDAAYNSAEKWILAALRHHHCEPSELVLVPSYEPNDALVSRVHTTLTEWRLNGTTARDAGVDDPREHELAKPPPQCVLAKARGWFIRHINHERRHHSIRELDDKWAQKLAGVKADAREVNAQTRDAKAKDGTLYHHKHDLAPSYEALTTMCAVAFTGDACVDANVLEAVEAGMAIALYLPTGARGSELKKMHLQSVGFECISHEGSGLAFECLKLTAFECKTKEHHLNQFLAASNPWRCGVGAFGVSLLVRVRAQGPPPFSMQRDDASWKVVGSSVGKSFDRRLNDVFCVAGVRRQSSDPLTYLGRHFGTRLLQHQGGSSEGGAARRGHTNGTTFAYSECPLPDLLRLMGNDPDRPFVPAHLQESLRPRADTVLAVLFPQLAQQRAQLDKRQGEVDQLRGKAVRVRTDEQLNDQERVVRGITLACQVALLCLVARPRTWKQWTILEEEPTMWQRAASNRVVQHLFAGNDAAIRAMNDLAVHVRRCEEAEIASRKATPEHAATSAVVAAVQQMSDRQVQREEELLRQQREMFQVLMQHVASSPAAPPSSSPPPLPPPPLPPRPDAVATVLAPPPTAAVVETPLAGVREKRKAHTQHDVAHFSSHPTLRHAFEYACDELAPRERREGAAWRTKDRLDKSRDRQWRFYRQLAIAVGVHGDDVGRALDALQARRDACASLTAFNKMVLEELKAVRNQEEVAKRVLGY